MEIFIDSHGFASWTDAAGASHKVRCALGRNGIGDKISEGDGHTPVGRFALRRVMVRSDRIPEVGTALPVSQLSKTDGWCDDPASADYNKPVTLPHPARHEELWRDDAVYDLIVEIGCNDDPVVPGKGSAIFMHVAKPDYTPTEGCVALALDDLLELLRVCDTSSVLVVGG
ncbi:MAG: L,D-transpeptidase family protein [Rhodospirillaceae bacterium]|nr:L,D-transpeptidase family protein [Rhodospirillaceae bacterium]MBL6931030.1 L,D-transpeptidase family protein [Rhodospirillales bacterium]MBL6941368.1 L,D-transpeptidase family protein [Rhodospirillales bacterium]